MAEEQTPAVDTTEVDPIEAVISEAREKASAVRRAEEEPDAPPQPTNPAEGAPKPEESSFTTRARQLAEEGDAKGLLNHLQALANEGQVRDLLREIGLDKKELDAVSKRFVGLRAKQKRADAARQELLATEEQLNRHAQALQAQYEPLAMAARAVEEGDYEEALRLLTGGKLTPLEFATKMAEQSGQVDPIARRAIRQEREAREKERQERIRVEQELAQQRQALARQHEEAGMRADDAKIAGLLAGSDDEDLAFVADDPLFVARVRNSVRQAIYNGWNPQEHDPESVKRDILALSKEMLLTLRKATAKLHRTAAQTAVSPPVGRGQAADPSQGGKPAVVRRAPPAPAVDFASMTADEMIRHSIREAEAKRKSG